MIPKTIHFCWFGGKELPDLAIRCISSWRKFMPEYRIIQWSEQEGGKSENALVDEVRQFDISMSSFTEEAYRQKKYAFVSDYARLWVIYRYGGLYFDTDVEMIRPLDDIAGRGNFMGFEVDPDGENTPGRYAPKYCFAVNLGLGFGMTPGHEFMKKLLKHYDTLTFDGAEMSPWLKTIVAHTTELLCMEGLESRRGIQRVGDITVYPHEYFAPINVITGRLKITENTYTIHRYMGSWDSGKTGGRTLKERIRSVIPEWLFIINNRIKRRRYRI